MLGKRRLVLTVLILSASFPIVESRAADWPMWRCGANRGAASPQQLPETLHLQWVRRFPPLKPAWSGELDVYFDRNYEPVVMGKALFIGSSINDSLTAIDTATGAVKWRFYADGPVRFAPVAGKGKIYFASDDGYLYCLDAIKGTLVWKFYGGPSHRKVIGNERLISGWPARGAPVLANGTIYFAAGIWPSMGVCLHAIDAESGKVVWTNDGSNYLYSCDRFVWPRNQWVPSADGVSPQGYIVATDERLIVPCGRSQPAVFDIKTGEILYMRSAGKGARTSLVGAIDEYLFSHGRMFSLATGESVSSKTYIPGLKALVDAVI